MNAYDKFVRRAEDRFGVKIKHEKSKAGHEMVELYMDGEFLCAETITGPGAGYSCHFGDHLTLTIFGWAYSWDDVEEEWYLTRDGRTGLRKGPNPFPEIAERPEL